MKKSTTFLLSGGAGRIICAIPALEKYQKLNPDDDFKILIHGWETLLWSHPTLQKRTFSSMQKGHFDLIKDTKIVSPEPYYVHGYYNQKLSMAEAFDEIINNTTDHSDLPEPMLYVNEYEKLKMQEIINNYKMQTGKKKVIVFQPYGSATELVNNTVIDHTNRSLRQEDYYNIVRQLSNEFLVIYFGEHRFRHPQDFTSINMEATQDLRVWLSLISECDYFLGVDSVGQHMARALGKKGLVIMGSTFEKNISYPDYSKFKFYRNKNKNPVYVPIRLVDFDGMFLTRENDGILNFDESQIREIVNIVKTDNSIPTSKLANVAATEVKSEEMKEKTVTRLTDTNSKTISYD
jgi:hypothetical protein